MFITFTYPQASASFRVHLSSLLCLLGLWPVLSAAYLRVTNLTRPADDLSGITANFTSRLDLYVYSYHLMTSYSPVNSSQSSNCTSDDPCLTISEAVLTARTLILADSYKEQRLLTFYLVADPVLECRVDVSAQWHTGQFRAEFTREYVIVIHRALLLPGCESVSLNTDYKTLNFAVDLSPRSASASLALKFHTMRIYVERIPFQGAAVTIGVKVGQLTVIFQDCFFQVASLSASGVSLTSMRLGGTLHYTMRNCTVQLTKHGKNAAYDQLFVVRSIKGDLLVHVLDSQFIGIASFNLKCPYGLAPTGQLAGHLPRLPNTGKYNIPRCMIRIVNCGFYNLQRTAIGARGSNYQILTTEAFAEISNVIIVGGNVNVSPFRFRDIDKIRMTNLLFNNTRCYTNRCAGGFEFTWAADVKRVKRPVIDCHNCTFLRSPIAATPISKSSVGQANTPFVILRGSAVTESHLKCSVSFSNLNIEDTSPDDASSPMFVAYNSNIVINGQTALLVHTGSAKGGRSLLQTENSDVEVRGYFASNTLLGGVLGHAAKSFMISQLSEFHYQYIDYYGNRRPATINLAYSVSVLEQYHKVPHCRDPLRGNKERPIPMREDYCDLRTSPVLVFGPSISATHPKWRTQDLQLCRPFMSRETFCERRQEDTAGSSGSLEVDDQTEPTATGRAFCNISNATVLVMAGAQPQLSSFVNTKLSWMTFRGASSQCYKRQGVYWHFLHTHCFVNDLEAAMKTLMKTTFIQDIALQQLMRMQRDKLNHVTNILIGGRFLYTPWSHSSGIQWNSYTNDSWHGPVDHSTTQISGNNPFPRHDNISISCAYNDDDVITASMADLTLYPAPGEHLTIHIATLDDLLNKKPASLLMQISSTNASVRLLRYGINNRYDVVPSIPFLSNTDFSGIAIGGPVGATGVLQVVMLDESSSGDAGKFNITIPFQLRTCHHGYKITNVKTALHVDSSNTDVKPMVKVCDCDKDSFWAIRNCSLGRYINIKGRHWAGDVSNSRPLLRSTRNERQFQTVISDNARIEDTAAYRKFVSYKFGTALCDNSLCNQEDWLYGSGKACLLNATGPLCGQCSQGTQMLLAKAGCIDCSKTRGKLPLPAYVVLVIILTILSSLVMFYYNMGLSPILDGWLFFVQTSWYLFPKTDKGNYIYSSMYTALTFGLGHACLEEDIDRLHGNLLLLIQPVTLLALFVMIRIARSYSKPGLFIARLQSHMKLVHVMWFTLVCSYFMLIFLSINMLWYVTLSNKTKVLALDGSIQFFHKGHLKFAIPAIAIIVIVIIPPPVILLLPYARSSPYLMGFIDEACSPYRLNRRWWASVTLLRRVAVAAVGSLWIGDSIIRLTSLATLLLLLLIMQKLAKPYKGGQLLSISYNNWEMAFLQTGICIAVLHLLSRCCDTRYDKVLRTLSEVLFILPTFVLILACLYKQCLSREGGYGRYRRMSLRLWWWGRGTTRSRSASSTQLTETVLNNMLVHAREPLIVAELREGAAVQQ